jgi:hypothetical protein
VGHDSFNKHGRPAGGMSRCCALCGVMINLLSEVADDSACGVFGHHVRFHENEWKARSGKASVPRRYPYSNRALSERHVKRFCGRLRHLDKAEISFYLERQG